MLPHLTPTPICLPLSLFRRTGSSSSSPPFRLALAWSPPPLMHRCHALAPARRHLGRSGNRAPYLVFLLYIHVTLLTPSRRDGSSSSSPPFRLALAESPPPLMTTLVSARGILAVQLTTIKVGPGSRISSLHFFVFLLSLPFSSSLAAPPAGIQSDSDPKRSSACRFSAGCCHGSVQSDLLYPSLLRKTRAPSGRPPFAFSRSPLDSLLVGSSFSSSSLMLLLYTNDLLTLEIDKLPWCLKRVWSPSLAPPSLFF